MAESAAVSKVEEESGDKAEENGQEENSCSICLEEIKSKDITVLDGCQHVYHFKCISSWMRNSNTCPLCRAKVTQLFQLATNRVERIGTPRIEALFLDSRPEVEIEYSCFICNETGGDLLACEGRMHCQKGAHLDCLGRFEAPTDEWKCFECTSSTPQTQDRQPCYIGNSARNSLALNLESSGQSFTPRRLTQVMEVALESDKLENSWQERKRLLPNVILHLFVWALPQYRNSIFNADLLHVVGDWLVSTVSTPLEGSQGEIFRYALLKQLKPLVQHLKFRDIKDSKICQRVTNCLSLEQESERNKLLGRNIVLSIQDMLVNRREFVQGEALKRAVAKYKSTDGSYLKRTLSNSKNAFTLPGTMKSVKANTVGFSAVSNLLNKSKRELDEHRTSQCASVSSKRYKALDSISSSSCSTSQTLPLEGRKRRLTNSLKNLIRQQIKENGQVKVSLIDRPKLTKEAIIYFERENKISIDNILPDPVKILAQSTDLEILEMITGRIASGAIESLVESIKFAALLAGIKLENQLS